MKSIRESNGHTAVGSFRCKVLRGILVLPFLLGWSGCKSPDEWISDVGLAVELERTTYSEFASIASEASPGPRLGKALSNWVSNVSALAEKVDELKEAVNSKKGKSDDPWGNEDLAPRLHQLEEQLRTGYFERLVQVDLHVPTWQEKSVLESLTQLVTKHVKLGQAYQSLFAKSGHADVRYQNVVEVSLDTSWYDTTQDCVTFVDTATVFVDDRAWCSSAARNYCGPQTDLDCVAQLFLVNALVLQQTGCMKIYKGTTHEPGDWEVEASFLKQISGCESKTKISS